MRQGVTMLDPARTWSDGGFTVSPLDPADLLARPERAERLRWLQARRRDIPATIRLMLDATTTCREGVTPVGLVFT